jgi:hypothetical protein
MVIVPLFKSYLLSSSFIRLNILNTFVTFVVFFLLVMPLHAAGSPDATTLEACKSLAKSCFFPDSDLRPAGSQPTAKEARKCFEILAVHPFCAGSVAGKFADRRSVLFTTQANQDRGYPGFLGSLTWNEECVARLDASFLKLLDQSANQFSAGLLEIDETFDDCAVDMSEYLSRP